MRVNPFVKVRIDALFMLIAIIDSITTHLVIKENNVICYRFFSWDI